ncbi:outer membrane protein assembly factor BamE [Haematobacter massiliensis]|uniref:Outer membrane protein assembly factor BamE domain-containing protein n=1 Tax=Haematobacter massiliensis TaxID=195105 RepID=A0A086Y7U5_9RHOB|nr:outer membrane protein assembly factor BamE [Haematobacter massiliensis]KFI30345.1 hypothetical protein CN97_12205 [Haematobacter massiliensis]OWJ70508.1 outer membrane protein assembly factor BamE [Haematobacter massiliensis]OWJ87352.1 outer membrane protein assembly factor BamE [Haematobacter massiliensis]QBJ24804.1 outer membrane protein assembly factor BamE [Haematobacter massiliensis]
MVKLRYLAWRSIPCLVLPFLVACSPVYRDHGYVPTEHELEQVRVGVDTRETVSQSIGQPSTHGVMGDSAWYFVQDRFRNYGALAPENVDRQVLAISFSPSGHVANIERFGLRDGNVVVLSRRVTESGISNVSFVTQLLRNLGTPSLDQILPEDR